MVSMSGGGFARAGMAGMGEGVAHGKSGWMGEAEAEARVEVESLSVNAFNASQQARDGGLVSNHRLLGSVDVCMRGYNRQLSISVAIKWLQLLGALLSFPRPAPRSSHRSQSTVVLFESE